MKIDLEKLKEYTHKTSMTSEEKFDMLSNIIKYTDEHPIPTNYYSIIFKHSFLYASIFALIIGTSATSWAAEGSLPGDLLYPVKTELNENIVKAFNVTNTQKAKNNVKLVDKRMGELTQMIVTEKDTPEKIDTIVNKLDKYKQDLQEYIQETENAELVYIELESVVDTHLEILENIAKDDSVKLNGTTSTEEIKDSNNSTSTENISGEKDAVSEISNFSTELKPIITEAKLKMEKDENNPASEKIKEDVRNRIIENTETRLKINITKSSDN
jgi:hypothetical protein